MWSRIPAVSSTAKVGGRSSAACAIVPTRSRAAVRRPEAPAPAHALDRAADQLTGEAATRATFEAGVAYRDAGYAEQARRRFASAAENPEQDLAQRAGREIDNTGFAIQAGAYTNPDNALARARELSAATRNTGLPPARIVQAVRSGRQFNIVQVGSFSTRADAEFARRQLGMTGTRVERIATADTQTP